MNFESVNSYGPVKFLSAAQIATRIQKYIDRGFKVYYSDNTPFDKTVVPWFEK